MTPRDWDAVVIGAGPGGATAARELARRGAAVLLVDKAAWPREKVCGGCVNGAALGVLGHIGLAGLPERLAARPLRRICFHAGGREAELALPAGASVSRRALDAALAASAVENGAEFLSATAATVEPDEPSEPWRTVELAAAGRCDSVRARVVLVADGLGGRALSRLAGFRPQVAADARIGLGAIVDRGTSELSGDAIVMSCGSRGYVGMAPLEDGRFDVAAAVDPDAVRSEGASGALARIFAEAGRPAPCDLAAVHWRGTPPLTRRRARVADRRLFVLGDAAGYVEPFTGEGMAAALLSAVLAVSVALEAIGEWRDEAAARWTSLHRREIVRRQRTCRALRRLVRRPRWVAAAAVLLGLAPWAAAPLVRRINRTSKEPI